METTEIIPEMEKPLEVNEKTQQFFLEISKWAKFLAIVGFVSMGILVIYAIYLLINTPTHAASYMGNSYFDPYGSALQSYYDNLRYKAIEYIVVAVIYFFPLNYLFKSTVNLRKGIENNNQNLFDSGAENLKSTFKYMGILMIVCLSIFVLAFLIGFLGY